MPIYTLYLSTLNTTPTGNQIVPVDKSNLGRVSWNIDWNSFLNGGASKYANCRVRFQLNSLLWAGVGTDWNTFNGYLGATFQSKYNAPTTLSTILGMVYPMDAPTTGTTNHIFSVSTLSEQGVDIVIPTGVQTLTLTFVNDDAQTIMASIPEYAILLQFELYNPL